MTEPAKTKLVERTLDLESLKALAHPLRVQIIDALSTYGAFTASGLAERLSESSGATSYHLRQLEKHGFVREVEGKGTGRERWWERIPGGIQLGLPEISDTPAGRAATTTVVRELERSRSTALSDFLEHGRELLGPEWVHAGTVSTVSVRLTIEQLEELATSWEEFAQAFLEKYRGQDLPGSRPVQVHFNAFPVVDGEVSPAVEGEPAP